jgi:CHAT domain-containing protein
MFLRGCRDLLGEGQPQTAAAYNNVAGCLNAQGQHEKALHLYERALAISRRVLGEAHPETASASNNVAACLDAQGQHGKALPLFEKALAIRRKVLGEEHHDTATSYNNVARCLWHLGRVAEATRLLQQSLAGQEAARFNLAASGFDRAVASRGGLSAALLLALGLSRLGQPANAFAHADAGLARGLLDDLVRTEADLTAMKRGPASVSASKLVPLPEIQKQLAPDAALVFWVEASALDEYQACIVRCEGAPKWVRLTGSKKDGKWTNEERQLHLHLYDLLHNPRAGSSREREDAIARLRKLRLDPVLAHLRARGGLPAVRQLLVVPTDWLANISLEVLTSEYRVSYVPSGSAFARMRRQARPLSGTSLLVLGDPAFTRKPGARPETLLAQPAPDPAPLPGARREVAALAGLVPHSTAWVGSEASEQRLDDLIHQGKLKDYRLVHFATHGKFDLDRPALSRIFLARDNLPDPLRQIQQGKKVYTGDLTVETILREWRDKLDADLVVLSACVTGLGTYSHGDGMLGFAHAFLSRGARSVVLSRWYVSDEATALLMQRFYQNLLGKRAGLERALGRAEALEEARNWLRNLSRKEAGDAVASLPRGSIKPLPGTGKTTAPRPVAPGEKPYAHPYYWSAFVLIGDPD